MDSCSTSVKIRPIDKASVHRICSGQVVLDLATAVKELVENSLDAGATNVEVRLKEYGAESFEVADNGCGVAPDNYQGLTLKYHTSKISDFEDLQQLSTFGFRGEALSSLCALANVSVLTKTKDQSIGVLLRYDHSGQMISQENVARSVGTTVTIAKLFATLPVRHKEFSRNIRREYSRLLTVLQAYALIAKGVRVTCTNQIGRAGRTTLVQTQGTSSLKDNVVAVFGTKTSASLESLDLSDPDGWCVEGFVSKPGMGCGRASGDRQFFYVNGRPVDMPKVAKLLNEQYKAFNSQQYPMVLLNFILPTTAYDVNVTPDKRKVFLHAEGALITGLKKLMGTVYAPSKYTYAINNVVGELLLDKVGKLPTGEQHKNDVEDLEPPETDDMDTEAATAATDGVLGNHTHLHERETPSRLPLDLHSFSRNRIKASNMVETKLTNETSAPISSSPSKNAFDSPSKVIQSMLTSFIPSNKRTNMGFLLSEEPVLKKCRVPEDEKIPSLSPQQPADKSFREMHLTRSDTVANPSERLVSASSFDQAATGTEETTSCNRLSGNGIPCEVFREPSQILPELPAKHCNRSDLKEKLSCTRVDGGESTHLPKESRAELDNDDNTHCHERLVKSVGGANHLLKLLAPEITKENRKFAPVRTTTSCATKLNMNRDPNEREELDCDKSGQSSPDSLCDVPKHTLSMTIPSLETPHLQSATLLSSDDSDFEVDPHNCKEGLDALQIVEIKGKKSLIGNKSTKILHENVVTVIQFELDKLRTKFSRGLISFHRKSDTQRLQKEKKRKRRFAAATLDGVGKGETEKEAALVAATKELERSFNKADFRRMKVLGQFNLGFILAKIDQDIFIIDQHASDEKYNFEHLSKTTVLNRQPLLRPLSMELSAAEELTVTTHMETFRQNGFDFVEDECALPGQRLKLSAVPFSKNVTLGISDVQELVALLAEDFVAVGQPTHGHHERTFHGGGSWLPRPTRIKAMLASRACRSSIMIGDSLSKTQMEKVVAHLADLDAPWNCPHGRPTMRHLVDLDSLDKK